MAQECPVRCILMRSHWVRKTGLCHCSLTHWPQIQTDRLGFQDHSYSHTVLWTRTLSHWRSSGLHTNIHSQSNRHESQRQILNTGAWLSKLETEKYLVILQVRAHGFNLQYKYNCVCSVNVIVSGAPGRTQWTGNPPVSLLASQTPSGPTESFVLPFLTGNERVSSEHFNANNNI